MSSLVFVAGARPNFMKIAPILRELEARASAPKGELVHTGQHYDHEMSGVFFEQLRIREPDVRLEVGSATHGVQTGKIMMAFDEYLERRGEPPRGIIVVGDVNSTMACALVGTKRGIPVAHVEAGLRSFDRTMPEEINRLVTDAVSDLLLVSEPAGMTNLAAEGIPAARVRYCGNVMIDTLVDQLAAARALATWESIGEKQGAYAVVTLHRPSNVDDAQRLRDLLGLLRRISERVPIVFPMHPRTAKMIDMHGLRDELARATNIRVISSLGYREFLSLMSGACLALSDSGGVQEETSFLGIPCITLRRNTERPVTTTHGTNVLVGDDLELAWQAAQRALETGPRGGSTIDGWDGRAAVRVVDAILAAWS